MSKISAAEVAKHSSIDDCWILVNGKVYDLTKFAPSHPGGAESMYYTPYQESCTDNEFSDI